MFLFAFGVWLSQLPQIAGSESCLNPQNDTARSFFTAAVQACGSVSAAFPKLGM